MAQTSLFNLIGDTVLQQKCTSCDLCNNLGLTTNCMSGVGPANVDLMFVGKAPGNEDDGLGKPMTGANGRLFHTLLQEAGIDSDRVYITNCLKCAPYDQELKDKYFKACKVHLKREIEEIKPKAIVAVGAEALNWLTGESGIKNLRKHGLPCEVDDQLLVFPIWQPAQLWHATSDAQRERLRAEMIEDLMWLRRRAENGELGRQDEAPVDYRTAKTIQDVRDFVAEILTAEWVYADLECCDSAFQKGVLHPDDGVIEAVGFSYGPKHARAIPYIAPGKYTPLYWTEEEFAEIKELIRQVWMQKKLVGANFIKFDQKWIEKEWGIKHLDIVFDTQLASYILEPARKMHGLDSLSRTYTDMAPWKKMFTPSDISKLCYYLCKDVDATARVTPELHKRLTPLQHGLLRDLYIPLVHTLKDMEVEGVKISEESLQELDQHLKARMAEVVDKMRAIPEVQAFEFAENTTLNPNADRQIGKILGDYMHLPLPKTSSGKQYSVAKGTLEAFQHVPLVQLVGEFSKLEKLHGTYCSGIQARLRKGKIHTSFKTTPLTGRLASEDPNLQNLPRKETAGKVLKDANAIKKLFVAEDGYVLLEADYSQAELRTLAMYSKDKNLIQIYLEDRDAHAATAAKVYGIDESEVTEEQRNLAKPVNFGIIYGRHESTICDQMAEAMVEMWKKGKIHKDRTETWVRNKGIQEGREFCAGHRREFPDVWRWMAAQEAQIRAHGFQETLLGWRRYWEYIDDAAIREAYNNPIQSTASHITLTALHTLGKLFLDLGVDARPLLTVHDSIVFKIHASIFWETVDLIRAVMQTKFFPFMIVPMKADFKCGLSWGSMKKVDVDKRLIA